MSDNSFGKTFKITVFGESHGPLVGVILDGCPAGLAIEVEMIQQALDKRRPGLTEVSSSRKETDRIEIASGVFGGTTTGAPICMMVQNKDVDSRSYEAIKNKPRPGHADFPAHVKSGGYRDYRGGGRFSGRITAPIVAAGAIARRLLSLWNVEVMAHTVEIGGISPEEPPTIDEIRRERYSNSIRCANPSIATQMEDAVRQAKRGGDSLGGVIECIALNVPVGVGSPIFDNLDGDIAKILFSIPAVKGVEFGAGFRASRLKGSENNDQYYIEEGIIKTETNNSGGILGGLSTGMPIIVRTAFKPPSSIRLPQKTVDLEKMREVTLTLSGRHDPCIVPRAVPVVEAAVSICLADHMIDSGVIPGVLQ
ncbi:chorismate synthase [Candidatus Bathyarchaeota archaeon]|nr:chorismate synthase [Candidatus Bathyarchaeota archaeon]